MSESRPNDELVSTLGRVIGLYSEVRKFEVDGGAGKSFRQTATALRDNLNRLGSMLLYTQKPDLETVLLAVSCNDQLSDVLNWIGVATVTPINDDEVLIYASAIGRSLSPVIPKLEILVRRIR